MSSRSLDVKQIREHALERHVIRLQRRERALRARAERYAWTRVAVFAAGIVAVLAAYYAGGAAPALAAGLAAAGAFTFAVMLHGRADRAVDRAETWRRIKAAHLARMRLDWAALPLNWFSPPAREHPFGADLNLGGERSLLQLINTAVTQDGRLRLRDWLYAPAPDVAATRARQALVRELVPMPTFRDTLSLRAMLGSDDASLERWTGTGLREWLSSRATERPASALLRARLWLLLGLAVLTAALFVVYLLGLVPGFWSVSLLLYVGLYITVWQESSALLEEALAWQGVLGKLRAVFAYLETFPYAPGSRLREFCAPFLDPAERPSAHLRRITWLVALAGLQRNPVLGIVLNVLLPWNALIARGVSRWKAGAQCCLGHWLDAWFELEALGSLAAFAYLNPAYSFPSIQDETAAAGGTPVFAARALGHPLIPNEQRVCNDFALERLGETVIVTGSNMSGKSSFLRTLGVNLCLAYAGGPVAAQSLSVLPFRLFTAITASDSVTDGISYFYAEVKRLKALLDALQQPAALPLFALIDEIFRGTNNRERLQGSRAYVRALAGAHGVSVISTHDLELVHLAEELPQVRNYHFEDSVRDGRMVFDYTLRPGPSPTTNALRIMQLEGLPVSS